MFFVGSISRLEIIPPITKNLPAFTVSEGFSCFSADIQFVSSKAGEVSPRHITSPKTQTACSETPCSMAFRT